MGTKGRHRLYRTPVFVKAARIAGAGGLAAGVFFVVVDHAPSPGKAAVAAELVAPLPLLAIATPIPTPLPTPSPVPDPDPDPDPAPAKTPETTASLSAVAPKAVTTTTPPPPPPPPPLPTTTPPPPPRPPATKKAVEPKKEEPAPVPDASPKGNVLAAARTFLGLGIPYVYGGKTAAGMDCSGFVWNALKKAGYNVPYRTSDALQAWAKPISAKAARPGDLVFYPGHVGIYAGNGRLVDSGGPPGVVERKTWGSPTYGRIP